MSSVRLSDNLLPVQLDRHRCVRKLYRWHLQVMSALHMIMQKWKQENVFRDHLDMDPNHVQLKIVMLGKLCGAVIGENGKTINDIKIATHTDIRVQVCGFRTITVSAVSIISQPGLRSVLCCNVNPPGDDNLVPFAEP